MIFRRLGLINKNQRGFTIIELLIAFTVTALITGAITETIFQVFNGSTLTANHMTAVKQLQNAGHRVSGDAQMAQSTNATGSIGFPLILTWTDWDTNNEQQVTYYLANNKLCRESVISDNGTVTDNYTSIMAQYITSASCNITNGMLTFTVTATVGSGPQQQSETRVYKISPRPN